MNLPCGTQLRQVQRKTLRIISKNAEEVREIIRAAWDERQGGRDYVDSFRTSAIRAETSWIARMEGGAVQYTSTWGRRNTATGDSWDGPPFNYVRFEGRDAGYNERMTEINSRELFERVFGVRK